jgi:hypothetical protein
MRVLRYLAYLAVGLILTLAVVAASRKVTASFKSQAPGARIGGWAYFALIAAAFLGSYWAWTYLPSMISYNELSVWFAALAIAPMLLLEADWLAKHKWSPAILGVISGVCLTLLALAKFPTALGLFAAIVAFIFLMRDPAMRWLYAGAGLAVGAVAMWLVVSASGIPLGQVVEQGLGALVTGEGAPGGYQASTLLQSYLVTAQDAIFVLRGPIILAILAFVVIYLLASSSRSDTPPNPRVLAAGAWLSAILVLSSLIWGWSLGLGRAGGGEAFAIGFAMAFVCVVAVVLFLISLLVLHQQSRTTWLRVALLLAITPLLVVAGTNNPITFQLHLVITPVFLLAVASVVIIWLKIAPTLGASPVLSTLTAIAAAGLAAFTLSAVWQGVWANPYRQVPLGEQTARNDSGILRWVSTDENTKNIAQGLPRIAQDLGLTATAATAWDNPGLVLFFNNSQFASTWQLPMVTTSTDELFAACEQAPQLLVVLDDGSDDRRQRPGDPASFYQAVSSCGSEYPSDYTAIATLQPTNTQAANEPPLGPSDPTPSAKVQVQLPKSFLLLDE